MFGGGWLTNIILVSVKMDVYNSGSGTGKGRALLVFVAVCLQGALVYSCSVLASPFYVTHLVNRGT